ncbi:hypothetical protein QOZ94_000007 [Xanthobacter agilis]|jgi:hypothetical protein|uniref:Uncharacterized protein n=1 Tax=Xanthobacter agilis TaxID=47492 RepID=A0ABU0L819_XANAG|nr:hypothetical protein [Xanthobacter agilis]
MLRSSLLAGACLMAGTALAQPAQPPDFHPRPMCVPIATAGQSAAKPCPIPPPPQPGLPPLDEGSPCQCGAVEGQVRNGPPPG